MSKRPESPQEESPTSEFQHWLNAWLAKQKSELVGRPVQHSYSFELKKDKGRPPFVDYSTKPRIPRRHLKQAMDDSLNVDLLLIGKTGNGKSATGNSILRRKAFKSMYSMDSVTTSVEYEVAAFNDRVIKVVDGPGVMDTNYKTGDHVNFILESMEYAITANPRGYHAFLLVVRFGERFTKEDRETIDILKNIFGESFVKDFCIVVITHGDRFDQDNDETAQSFEEWCRDQHGIVKELMNECEDRVMLFDNKTKDEAKRYVQVAELLEVVDSLRFKGNRYTDENFEKAREARERIKVEAKKPLITDEMVTELSLILAKLQDLKLNDDFEVKTRALEELITRLETLLNNISSEDCGTGVLHNLCETVTSLLRTVEDEIKFCKRMKVEIEKVRKEEEEKRNILEDQIRNEREEHDKRLKEQQLLSGQNRQFEAKQEKKRKKLEERKMMELKIIDEVLALRLLEKLEFYKKYAEIEEQYRKLKTDHDTGIFKKVVSVVAWPFRKIKDLFCKTEEKPTNDTKQ